MKKTLLTLFTICLSSCAIISPFDKLFSINSAVTYNERHVEKQLNGQFLPQEVTDIVADISLRSRSEQRRLLNDLSGEQYANLIQTNQVSSQQFMRRMFDAVRYDSLGLHCGQNCDPFKFWSAIGGGQAFLRSSHGAKGFRLSDFNIAVGAQKPLNFCFMNSWLTVGLAADYEYDDIRFRRRGHGKGNNWQGAFYYMWNNCRFYSFSATILGSDCIKVRRHINLRFFHRNPRSKARITQWTSYSEAGLNLQCRCVYVQPFLGVEYAFYRRHALSEKRRFHFLNLHVRGKNVSATIGRLGVHLTTALPCWDLFLSGDLAWRFKFNFLQERIKAHFREFGREFRIKGPHQKTNGVEGALYLSKCFCERWQTYIELAGERWDRYSAWNLAGGVELVW